jgi:uncharacterized ion transporter superfamily protein YfcC
MNLSFPHPLIILLGFFLMASIATSLIPSGSFDRVLDEHTGRQVVLAGSFNSVDDIIPSFWEILKAIPEGIIAEADISYKDWIAYIWESWRFVPSFALGACFL